jgi:mgtE-like transporter
VVKLVVYSAPKIIKESIPLLTICIGVEVLIGQVLNTNQNIISIPIILALIPVINGVGGNIGSILGARLASGLHIGIIQIDFKGEELRKNMVGTFILGICTFSILALIIYLVMPIIGINVSVIGFWRLMIIIIGAGVLLILSLIGLSVISAFYSFKKGIDPDNSVTPIVTTSGDALGIICLFLMVGLVGIG